MKKLPFDLEKALAGKKVVTRDGREVTELHLFNNTKSMYQLLGCLDGMLDSWTDAGCSGRDSTSDLFMGYNIKTVNGFEIAAPESKPLEEDTTYFLPELQLQNLFMENDWCDSSFDNLMLKRGLVHLTKENAIAHAKAMIGIDPNEEEK